MKQKKKLLTLGDDISGQLEELSKMDSRSQSEIVRTLIKREYLQHIPAPDEMRRMQLSTDATKFMIGGPRDWKVVLSLRSRGSIVDILINDVDIPKDAMVLSLHRTIDYDHGLLVDHFIPLGSDHKIRQCNCFSHSYVLDGDVIYLPCLSSRIGHEEAESHKGLLGYHVDVFLPIISGRFCKEFTYISIPKYY